MKGHNGGRLLIAMTLVLWARLAPSQDLTVFQDAAPDNGRGQIAVAAAALPGAPAAIASAFVLKGIYRFGDEYHISLQLADGVTQSLVWQADEDRVLAANGYSIEDVRAREVTFELPPGVNCESSGQAGTQCVGRSQMVLSFSETAPVAETGQPAGNPDAGPAFGGNQGDQFGRGGGNDIGALFEAANAGDAEAAAALQALFANRGRGGGGRGGAGGGRGGRGGGFGGATDNGGGNGSGAAPQ